MSSVNPLVPQQTKVKALESQEKIDHKAEDTVQYSNTLKSSHVAAWKELWGLDNKPHETHEAEEAAWVVKPTGKISPMITNPYNCRWTQWFSKDLLYKIKLY